MGMDFCLQRGMGTCQAVSGNLQLPNTLIWGRRWEMVLKAIGQAFSLRREGWLPMWPDMWPVLTGYRDWRGKRWKTEDEVQKAVRNVLGLAAWNILLKLCPSKPLCKLQETCTEVVGLSSYIIESDDNKDNFVFWGEILTKGFDMDRRWIWFWSQSVLGLIQPKEPEQEGKICMVYKCTFTLQGATVLWIFEKSCSELLWPEFSILGHLLWILCYFLTHEAFRVCYCTCQINLQIK